MDELAVHGLRWSSKHRPKIRAQPFPRGHGGCPSDHHFCHRETRAGNSDGIAAARAIVDRPSFVSRRLKNCAQEDATRSRFQPPEWPQIPPLSAFTAGVSLTARCCALKTRNSTNTLLPHFRESTKLSPIRIGGSLSVSGLAIQILRSVKKGYTDEILAGDFRVVDDLACRWPSCTRAGRPDPRSSRAANVRQHRSAAR